MKSVVYTMAVIIVACIIRVSFADDCRIIEYQNHYEAICEGGPSGRISTIYANNTEVRRLTYSDMPKYQTPSDVRFSASGLEISGLVVMAASDSIIDGINTFKVDFKCDVYGETYQDYIVTIVGKNRNGAEVTTVDIKGSSKNGKNNVVTGSVFIPAQQYYDSQSWEPKSLASGKTVSSFTQNFGDIYIENVSSSITGFDPDTIKMKKGVVFQHNRHKSMLSCSLCHTLGTGKIQGFGKDLAHKMCKGCHTEMNKGPTSCKGCHT